MPSGKHKSKENTWTEKDLTEALQGEKPRRSKDESRHRESKEEGPQKRHSRERGHDEREKDRQRSKHDRSERHREAASLDPEEDSRRTRRSKDDDREKERRHRNRDKLKDDIDEDNENNERTKERHRRERQIEDDREDTRRRDDYSGGENEESARDKERRKKSREDRDVRKGKSRDHDGERERRRDHDAREGRSRDHDGDREPSRERDGRKGRSRGHDGDREPSRDRRDKGERREKDKEERRDKEKDERRKEKDERRRDKKKDERRRDKEEKHRDKDRLRETEADDRGSERRRDKEKERPNHTEEIEEEDYERERERRRREKEEKREKERSKEDAEIGSKEKEKRRKEKGDKEKSEENKEDRRKHREDKEKRKQQQDRGEEGNERRHKERKEKEYENSGKKSKEKLEVNGRLSPKLNEPEVDEEIEDNNGEDNYDEDNYEDDFEDYEDDFEEEEEDEEDVQSEHEKGKLVEIFKAINAENDDVRKSPYQKTTTDDSKEQEPINDFVKSSTQGRINFVAAKQKHVSEFVASKTKKRAEELHHLIELDVASYDIFDLPPLNEYELYIKSYGQSDSQQAYVQCHDDIVEKEMQTEEIEMSSKWTQNPPDDFKGCGDGDENIDKNESTENAFSPHSVDSVKLSNFLQQAGQVCLILLEENVYGKTNSMFKERNDINISDGFIQLATKLPFLEGRRVLDMNFNSIQTHLLLTAHDCNDVTSNAATNDNLRGKGIVCFWNVNEPTQPQKILFCESTPRSCCFSPIKSSLVFAGLEDGSIVIWDIRESSSLHSTVEYRKRKWIVRRPTFSTAGVFNNENHLSPVQSILPISLPKESAEASIRTSLAQDNPIIGMAFQLASLEENGVVHIWVVVELDKPDEAGSESDLGLAPGGRVKLIKSTSIQVKSPHREIFSADSIQTSVMQFSNKDPNHFYVGTDRGWVVHCTRYGGRIQPKIYKPQIDSFVTVTAIDVSPWSIPIMLVGCADGTLRLHDLHKEYAIRSWTESTQSSPIVQVKWSRSRPGLFYVLDTKSNLYIWDLLQNDGRPVATEYFKHGKLLYFSISNDYESLGIGLPGRKSELVLNYEGGTIELHRLKQTLTNAQADELDTFASLVDSFI